jgi:hypothetical protein
MDLEILLSDSTGISSYDSKSLSPLVSNGQYILSSLSEIFLKFIDIEV